MKHYRLLLLTPLFLIAGGCHVEDIMEDAALGSPISFSVNTGYANGVETRTEYSGKDQTGGAVGSSSSWERIDWVNGDLIRIWCAQETDKGNIQSGGGTYADYRVKSHTETATGSDKGSYATLENASSNGLTWSEREHVFYALYPSPATSGVDGSKVTLDGATITATLPSTQVVSNSSSKPRVYQPDMNYAYMWATQTASAGTRVSLDFAPLMTAFEFTVDSGDDATMSLYSFTMRSSSTALVGDYTATVSGASCTVSSIAYSAGVNDAITVDFGGSSSPTVVTKGNPITFTVFAVPQLISGVTLSFVTSKGTRTLELKQGGSFVSFTARKKIRITGLGVPGTVWEYTMDDISGPVTMDCSGGLRTMATGFRSYRTHTVTGRVEAVPFHWEYSSNGSTGWTEGLPSWLDGSMDDYTGGNTGTDVKLKMKAQVNSATGQPSYSWRTSKGGTTAVPFFDISTVDPTKAANAAGGWNSPSSTQSTANCYVVQASGKYKFPLVFGNALKEGSDNHRSYTFGSGETNLTSEASLTVSNRAETNPETYTVYRLGCYKDHKNADITQPWITVKYPPTSHTYAATLLWMDAPGLVEDVALSADKQYITFSVPSENICQGNAVVALLIDGEIAWSWHIWVTDEDLSQMHNNPKRQNWSDESPNPNPVTQRYKYARVNLGTCESRTEKYDARECYVRAVQSISGITSTSRKMTQTGKASFSTPPNNPFYQWGRKDLMYPVIGTTGGTTTLKPIYYTDASYAEQLIAKESGTDKRFSSVSEGIKYPYKFVVGYVEYNGSVYGMYNWCQKPYFNLWNSNGPRTASDWDSSNIWVAKTVYDPCPYGYKVPSSNELDNLYGTVFPWYDGSGNSLAYRESTYYGSRFYTTGYRNGGDGSPSAVGAAGLCWSTNMKWGPRTLCPTVMYVTNLRPGSTPNDHAGGPCNGYSVRPFQDIPWVAP